MASKTCLLWKLRETIEEGKIKVKGYTSGWGKEIKTLPVNYVGALENRSS